MNWFLQNRFLGGFLAALSLTTILAVGFLFHEKGAADDQQSRLDATMAELTRLRAGKPFPKSENVEKTKAQTDSYRSSLAELETELKTRTLPIVPMQPNEFQTQLRQSVSAVIENARTSKVQLPENFYLGFDEYATSLPNSAATAALLGRELKAIEALLNLIIAAHVDSLGSLTRTPLAQEKSAAPAATPTPPKMRVPNPPPRANAAPAIEGNPLELSFAGSPAATRKVLNGIVAAKEQLFVIRALVVKNQVDKGPKRESAEAAATPAPTTKNAPAPGGVNFIVGTEHVNVSAKVEIVSPTR